MMHFLGHPVLAWAKRKKIMWTSTVRGQCRVVLGAPQIFFSSNKQYLTIFADSTRVGSVLDIRMRREARRSRAVLLAKTAQQPEMAPSKCQQAPKEVSTRSTEETRKDLADWLRTMKSFVLGTDPTNALVEKSLKLGSLPSSVSSSAAGFDPMEVGLFSRNEVTFHLF